MKFLLVVIVITINVISVFSESTEYFIENKGQWSDDVKFLAQTRGLNAWITDDGIILDFNKEVSKQSKDLDSNNYHSTLHPAESIENFAKLNNSIDNTSENFEIIGHIVKLIFVGSNKLNNIETTKKQDTYFNFFLGDNSSNWKSHVSAYQEIMIKDLYKGIDLRLYFDNGYLRYDFELHPNSSAKEIKLKFEGQNSIDINNNNELVLNTSIGDVFQKGLFAYQNNIDNGSESKKKVECKYKFDLNKNVIFDLSYYDKKSKLIIDPFLFSSVFGSGDIIDNHSYLTIDSLKNVYVVGWTGYMNIKTTTGAYQNYGKGIGEILIGKLNKEGSGMIYLTYLGGRFEDIPRGVAIDKEGNLVVIGETLSDNFPTTEGVLKTDTYQSYFDVFVTKFNSDGTDVIFSSLFGGQYSDKYPSIAIDDENNIYLTGVTYSTDLPITEDAFCKKRLYLNHLDIFVSKINSDFTKIDFCTYITADNIDLASSIAVDKEKNVIITGWTYSNNFPFTDNALDKFKGYIKNDSADIFLTIFNPTGTALKYSSYFGGNQSDRATCLGLDKNQNICISGYTIAEDFPVTNDAFDKTFHHGYEGFFTKFSKDGKTLLYSTFFGSNDNEWIQDIAFDNKNNTYLIGAKQKVELVVGHDTTGYRRDFKTTISKISGDFKSVDHYRLFGDTILSSNFGNSLTVDDLGDIYITGTEYWGFPVSKGAYQYLARPPLQNGDPSSETSGGYIFVCKLNFNCDNLAFSYPDFENYTNFSFNGTALPYSSKIKLTESDFWQAGSIWYKDKLHVETGFKTQFCFSFNNGTNRYENEPIPGADGITFVIQNDSPEALGAVGSGIGYEGLKNCLAIEFDTYRNVFLDTDAFNTADPDGNHIAIFSNGKNKVLPKHDSKSCIGTMDSCMSIIPDGRKYYVKIEYLQLFKTLEISLDTLENFNTASILTLVGTDFSDIMQFDEGGTAWIGFTSATGIAYEEHLIESWSFCPFEYYGGISSKKEEISQNHTVFQIYPNPANDYIIIENSKLTSNPLQIDIFDILGNNVISKSMNGSFGQIRINTSNLQIGKYFVRLISGNEVFSTQITIIE